MSRVALLVVLLASPALSWASEPPLRFGGALYGLMDPDLTPAQQQQFLIGHSFFTDPWVAAPASTTARDGLGPFYNARACHSCHRLGGRGQVPPPGKSPVSLVLRLGRQGQPDPWLGSQLQPLGVGIPGEGSLALTRESLTGQYPDATPFTLQRLTPQLISDAPVAAAARSLRLAQPLYGLGLLAQIPDAAIVAWADPDDSDGDGISGRPHWHGEALGRFGHKASHPTLQQQVAHAFRHDIGITSSYYPEESCTAAQPRCLASRSGGDPVEISDALLAAVTTFTASLRLPRQHRRPAPEGAMLFSDIGCSGCHRPSFHLTHGDKTVTIWPYSDLLLHDMGEGLADDLLEGEATGREWRTAPLWGLAALPPERRFFLHDGRARSLEEAILWHGGEALASRNAFMQLSAAQRQRLLDFLNAL